MPAMVSLARGSVVSGHIHGWNQYHAAIVEIAYNEYNMTAAFALSSLLALLALVTLIVQQALTKRQSANDE